MPDILVVCTANIARSPLLAALLQREAERRLGQGAVTVESAGVDAPLADPAAEGSRRVAERLGVSLDEHRSRPIRNVPMDDVVVILTMTRRHRRLVSGSNGALVERTFPLRELVRIVDGMRSDGRLDELLDAAVGPRDRIGRVTATAHKLRARRLVPRRLDVPDPLGHDRHKFQALGDEFVAATQILADAWFGPAAS